MSRQRRRSLLMVSASLLVMLLSAVQFQAQQPLPPPSPADAPRVAPSEIELLLNGGFETAANNTAAHWKGTNLLTTTDRVCNRIGHPSKPNRIVAHEGNCAFQLGAEITNVKRQLKQVVVASGAPGDILQMSFWAAGTELTAKPRAQVTVVYTDNSKKKFNVTAPTGTYAYKQFSGEITLAKTPKSITVNFIASGSGKLFIDEASLRRNVVGQAPAAVDDTLTMIIGTGTGQTNVLTNDSVAVPAALVTSFGGGSLGGAVTDRTAPASASLAGGTLTVNRDGTVSLANPLQAGLFTFSYRLGNAMGFSDATVSINIQKAPSAVNDGPYYANAGSTLNVTTAGNDLLDNDDRGFPLASIVSFGLLTATEAQPGAAVSLAGGSLTVRADGSFQLTTPTVTGVYTFHYAISNQIGAVDTATVTLSVRRPPTAEQDSFTMQVSGTLNGDLKADNGFGVDYPGMPAFNSLQFGSGVLGGDVTTNTAPASVAFAGGMLTVNADGTFSLVNPTQTGTFVFRYRLTNAIPSFSNATVTIQVQ